MKAQFFLYARKDKKKSFHVLVALRVILAAKCSKRNFKIYRCHNLRNFRQFSRPAFSVSGVGSGRSWTELSDTQTTRICFAPPPWYIIYWWSFTGTGASITLFIRTTASAVRTGCSATPRRRTLSSNTCRAITGARLPWRPSVIFPGN